MTTANEIRINDQLWIEIEDDQYRLHSNSDSALFDSIEELIESLPENLQSTARTKFATAEVTMTMTCDCCGGSLPEQKIWEMNRNSAGDCTGALDTETGRCRAFADDDLWVATEEIRFSADGSISMVYCDGDPVRCPTQNDMDTLPVGEDMESTYDYRDIGDDGRQWIDRLSRSDSGFPAIDNLCAMSEEERDMLAGYLRAEDPSLSDGDMEFSAGVAEEIESL